MKDNILVDLSRQFAVDVVNLCTEVKEHRKSNILLNQLLRSGTSVGANIHEANYASSKADFINKFQIALKECYETLVKIKHEVEALPEWVKQFYYLRCEADDIVFPPERITDESIVTMIQEDV